MHGRICNVLDLYWYPKFPDSQGLVVTAANKPAVAIYERHCVDSPQMVVILLQVQKQAIATYKVTRYWNEDFEAWARFLNAVKNLRSSQLAIWWMLAALSV